MFDGETPRDASCGQGDAIREEGCVLLSSWLPEKIEEVGSWKNISRRYVATDFTYSSVKVSRNRKV